MFCSEVVPSRNGQKQKNSIGVLHVRFAPESGHRATGLAGPLCAISGHLHCNKFLLDHFVGELPELPRHIEAERLGSL
jgi:hypothetical protein